MVRDFIALDGIADLLRWRRGIGKAVEERRT
jgi:hypothetical protein